MRSEAEAHRALALYADMVRRICFIRLQNHADVEDVFQEVFLKYVLHDKAFQSDVHEKAWFIRVSINACKDSLKRLFRKESSLDQLLWEPAAPDEDKKEVWAAVFSLPPKYRDVVYLFYYEGYSAVEISDILGKRPNTIYTWLHRAKAELKVLLGGDDEDE